MTTPPSGRRRERSWERPLFRGRTTGVATAAAAMSLLALLSLRSAPMTGAFLSPRPFAAGPPPRSPTQAKVSRAPGSDADDDDGEASSRPDRRRPPRALPSPILTTAHRPVTRLTEQQEVALLRRMRDPVASSLARRAARETLLLHNLPLVRSIATKVLSARPHLAVGRGGGGTKNDGSNTRSARSRPGGAASESRAGAALTRDDLLHEGTIGLAEAIDRYDLSYARDGDLPSPNGDVPAVPGGARLGTYATYWIRARILRAVQDREHALRFPERVLQASHRLVRAAREMGLEWAAVGELVDGDVAVASSSETSSRGKLREKLKARAGIASDGLLRDAVRVRSMSVGGTTVPLESWMSPSSSAAAALGGGDDASEGGTLPSSGGQEHVVETLSKFLAPREVEVLSLRYGLGVEEDEEEEEAREDGRVFRDYQAEAEEDLFGPGGILSHYSETPPEVGVAVAADTVASPVSKKRARPAPARLLPFKEIGRRMEFSGEYCRRTCAGALEKLTRAAEEGRLAESDFLLGW